MALPTKEEAFEAGLQSIKDCLKKLRPQLKASDPNRTRYDNLDLLECGNYVGVIEKHRLYTTNQGTSGTALVISFRGKLSQDNKNFYAGNYGDYEMYFSHAKDYSWNKLVDLYHDLGFSLRDAGDVVDVNPDGYLVECSVCTSRTNTKHFIKYIYAASQNWPVGGQPEDPGKDIFADIPEEQPAPTTDESATPPEQDAPPFFSPDDF